MFNDRCLQKIRKTNFYRVLEDIEYRENRSKKVKRKFVRTENKIKDIIFTNTHRTKLML